MTSSLPMAQRMLDAAICAYSVDLGRPFRPMAKYWNPIGIDPAEPLSTFTAGSNGVDGAFVGTTTDNWVVLSLRGTLSSYWDWTSFKAFLEDWWQDDETRPVPMMLGGTLLGHVERGFLNALVALWPGIKAALDRIDWTTMNGIQITGHSKGAAMTFLAAAVIKEHYPQAKAINVHAFAAPLAGQPDFAAWYDNAGLCATSTRYQRENDLVPFVPPTASWNLFDHIKPYDSATAAFLWAFSSTIWGGYKEMGKMVYLPNPASTAPHETGPAALANARRAMIDAINRGEDSVIAGAHSIEHSYWPAMFRLQVDCDDVETVMPRVTYA